MSDFTVINMDCMDAMRELLEKGVQVDSILTDPPYELGFMGKKWDKTGIANNVEMWKLCYSILKPGGHLLAFGGSRTYHRMASAIEDAGFEVRDQIMWIYGQGFPKSLDISKAIDKRAIWNEIPAITAPATELTKQWQGWGTALKPAHEPIVLARKPLSEKTVIANVLKHGTGAINIDSCRVETQPRSTHKDGSYFTGSMGVCYGERQAVKLKNYTGRFPANLIHDGSDEIEQEFAKYGESKSNPGIRRNKNTGWKCSSKSKNIGVTHSDSGTPSRFFYCAKANKQDRSGSNHPTIKPIALMRYLCRLITPEGGLILDPFAGSGTTGQAAIEEGFKSILIEKDDQYVADIHKRLGIV